MKILRRWRSVFSRWRFKHATIVSRTNNYRLSSSADFVTKSSTVPCLRVCKSLISLRSLRKHSIILSHLFMRREVFWRVLYSTSNANYHCYKYYSQERLNRLRISLNTLKSFFKIIILYIKMMCIPECICMVLLCLVSCVVLNRTVMV